MSSRECCEYFLTVHYFVVIMSTFSYYAYINVFHTRLNSHFEVWSYKKKKHKKVKAYWKSI